MFNFNLLTEDAAGNNGISNYLFLGFVVLLMIAFFVWTSISSRKRQQETQKMISGIKIGDKLKTIGGICGVVIEINDEENTFVLETGTDNNKCAIKFDKNAIYQTESVSATKEVTEDKPVAETKDKE